MSGMGMNSKMNKSNAKIVDHESYVMICFEENCVVRSITWSVMHNGQFFFGSTYDFE